MVTDTTPEFSCDALIKRFDRDGVVLLPGLLSTEQVQTYAERAANLYESLGKGPYPAFLFDNAVQRDPLFLPLIDFVPTMRIVCRILGPFLQLLCSEVWIRPPSAEGIHWHRDGGFLMRHLSGLYELKVQFFLSDVHGPESGNLVLLRGSHRRPSAPGALADDAVRRKEIQLIPKAGDVAIWSAGTWHRVQPNLSPNPRISVILAYGFVWMRKYDYNGVSPALLGRLNAFQAMLLADGTDQFQRGEYYYPTDLPRRTRILEEALGPLPGLPFTGEGLQ
jgi:hypothetical protein